jgi:hypothetical protein
MKKKTGAEGFFDDGLTYLVKNKEGDLWGVRPKHIHFEVWTDTVDMMETCDFRFYSVEKVEVESTGRILVDEESKTAEVTKSPAGPTIEYKKKQFSDVAFFRLGYFDYLKLNTQNMLMKYEASKWFSIDLILDYDDQRASIYVNQQPLKSASFFTQREDKLDSGNALSIYGLSPGGTSKFRNIKMCESICPEQALLATEFTDLSGAMLSYGSSFSLLVGSCTLFMSLLA